jgi:Na+/H+ antiporter NhaD/arsenite permease-like protein
VSPHKLYAGIDGGLLLMFAGLFIVVAGAEKLLLTTNLTAVVNRLHLENAWILAGVLPDPGRAWRIVAMSSTFAGNLTLIGPSQI